MKKPIERVKEIEEVIRALKHVLLMLQRQCPHVHIDLKVYKDLYSGWGYEKTCPDCGLFISYATTNTLKRLLGKMNFARRALTS
jgi:hypothetical protein